MNIKIGMVVWLFALASCQQEPSAAPITETQASQLNEADIAKIKQQARDELLKQQADAKAASKAVATKSPKADADEAMIAGGERSESHSLCWQDYCPCDSPETSLDRTICRNAKGGVEMSDDQWAIGAQARDSKREGDRLNREMDDILADTARQRRDLQNSGSDY